MQTRQKKFLNALNILFSPNPIAVRKLLYGVSESSSVSEEGNFANSPEWVFNLSPEEISRFNFKKKTIESFLKKKKEIDIEKEWKRLEKWEIKLVTEEEEDYPSSLRNTSDPPVSLYIKGGLLSEEGVALNQEDFFASVGTRLPSSYGKMAVSDIVGELSEYFITVSGLARGIDSLSHKAALERGKKTVAVLATGLDTVFPPENKELKKEIEKTGLTISEFPLGTPGMKYNFPLRNRIIAGISKGVIVTEGGRSSGSLITANLALEEGKEVFAVPGSIYSKVSEGPNRLIKQGAYPVTRAEDVVSVFNLEKAVKEEQEVKGDTQEENLIIECLKKYPCSVDEAVKETGLEVGKVNSLLVLMEIKGKVKREDNKYRIKK